MSIATVAKRAAAGIAAAGIAAAITVGAAGSASAYEASYYAKAHDVFGSIKEHCHQNNIFAPADHQDAAVLRVHRGRLPHRAVPRPVRPARRSAGRQHLLQQ